MISNDSAFMMHSTIRSAAVDGMVIQLSQLSCVFLQEFFLHEGDCICLHLR